MLINKINKIKQLKGFKMKKLMKNFVKWLIPSSEKIAGYASERIALAIND